MIFNMSMGASSGSSNKSDLVKGTYPVATGDSISAGDLVVIASGYATKKSPLSDLTEGTIIQLNENGSPVDFYVAKQDYESDLNGSGRVLIVRKDIHSNRNVYPSGENPRNFTQSDLYDWLNSNYKNMLDSDVQSNLGETKYIYTALSAEVETAGLNQTQSSIFLLSLAEYGLSYSNVLQEGSSLPISSSIRIAQLNGVNEEHWTRSMEFSNVPEIEFAYCTTSGTANILMGRSAPYGVRPAFTLPSDFTVDIPLSSPRAIALTSGTAGQNVEVIFCGTTTADFATEGEYFNWDGEGVKAYAPMDGVLTVFPWYDPASEIPAMEFGSYSGRSGSPSSGVYSSFSVNLGYRPKAVLVFDDVGRAGDHDSYMYYRGGLVLDGLPIKNDSNRSLLEITDTGFTATSWLESGNADNERSYMAHGTHYFIAWR